jgi:hypothetical protein
MGEGARPGRLSDGTAAIIAGLGSVLSVLAIYPINVAFIPALGDPAALLVTVPAEDLLTAAGLAYLVWSAPYTLSTTHLGLRLGACAGVAFGLVETAINNSGMLGILLSTPLHMITSAMVGIGLTFAAGRHGRGWSDSSVFLNRGTVSLAVIAISCHLAYDLLARGVGPAGVLAGLGLAGVVLFAIYRYLPQDASEVAIPGPIELLTGAFARIGSGGAARGLPTASLPPPPAAPAWAAAAQSPTPYAAPPAAPPGRSAASGPASPPPGQHGERPRAGASGPEIAGYGTAPAPWTPSVTSPAGARPFGLSALAILAVIGGVLGLLEGLSLLKFEGGIALYGLCVIGTSAGDLAVAWGVWQLRPWGWTGGVSVVTAQIVLAMWAMLGGLIGAGLVSLAVNGVVLWYLDRPETRVIFGRAPRGAPRALPGPFASPPPVPAAPLASPPPTVVTVARPAGPSQSVPPQPGATRPGALVGYCVSCGTALAAGFAFCPKCGSRAQPS